MEEVVSLNSKDELIYLRNQLCEINQKNSNKTFEEKSGQFQNIYMNHIINKNLERNSRLQESLVGRLSQGEQNISNNVR